jgi:plasmid stability protein
VADILITNVDESTKELLRRRAERRGRSLEADLRETLEKLAREEAEPPDDAQPFGDWLVAI